MTTFGVEVEVALTDLRALAEARMLSTVRVGRATGGTTTAPNGLETDEYADVHIDVPFRLDGGSSGDGGSRGVSVGGVTYEEATAVGHLPVGTTLEDNDLIEITAGEWPGTVWRVVAAVMADQKTARRVPITEASMPDGWV